MRYLILTIAFLCCSTCSAQSLRVRGFVTVKVGHNIQERRFTMPRFIRMAKNSTLHLTVVDNSYNYSSIYKANRKTGFFGRRRVK